MVQAQEHGENEPPKGFLSEVFGGQLSSRVACEVCHHTSVTLEPFMDLSLPIPAGTLADMDDSMSNRYAGIFTTCLRRYSNLQYCQERLGAILLTDVLLLLSGRKIHAAYVCMVGRHDATPSRLLPPFCCQGRLCVSHTFMVK